MIAPYRIRKPLSIPASESATTSAENEGGIAVASETRITVDRATAADGFGSYLDRLMKMIPAEVIGLYLVGNGIIPANQKIILIIWTVVCFIAVIAVRIYGTSDPSLKPRVDWPHVVISAIAFVIWIYTIGGGPFAAYHLTVPYIGSLLVLVWTFFVPLFYHGADSYVKQDEIDIETSV